MRDTNLLKRFLRIIEALVRMILGKELVTIILEVKKQSVQTWAQTTGLTVDQLHLELKEWFKRCSEKSERRKRRT